MTHAFRLALALGLALAAGSAHAQGTGHDHGSHSAPAAAAEAPSTTALKAADEKMMQDMMAAPYTGNVDVDFRVHMIPHHEGALAMARVVLEHSKDPQTRKLAEQVIADQQKEITDMKAWLAKNAK
ncbi:DUF305 domain-containing protein [Xanthobacteraceae bacterium A53D]